MYSAKWAHDVFASFSGKCAAAHFCLMEVEEIWTAEKFYPKGTALDALLYCLRRSHSSDQAVWERYKLIAKKELTPEAHFHAVKCLAEDLRYRFAPKNVQNLQPELHLTG